MFDVFIWISSLKKCPCGSSAVLKQYFIILHVIFAVRD
jgi:hypothetical protein